MTMTFLRIPGLACLSFLAACSSPYNPLADYEQLNPSTILATPEATANTDYPAEQVARGKYMVGLLGCGSCHTNGALIGEARQNQLLAGSDTGIAYSNPLAVNNPGVVYPANLTPDMETGIGSWTIDQIITMLQTGVDNHSGQTLPVMPWPSYAHIEAEDALAIASYLKSLPPVRHRVPTNVAPGRKATAPFVHFGVYRSKQ
ncbi:MAG: hypothetical protein RQ899_11815 [Pseudomonadales bacterium]|nr:hypothetical protein [Pseudomonadales bacterium]